MHIAYRVVPRYTAGSPAGVSEEIMLQVSREESAAYKRCLTGAYGEELQHKAQTLGLAGIALQLHVYARHINYYDVLTNERYEMRNGVRKNLPAIEYLTPADGHG